MDIAAKWAGIKTVCYVEYDRYAQAVLMSRIRSGDLDNAPIWDDVRSFDGRPWEGMVDVISGGFPCQDVSTAGKRASLKEGTRSGLWSEYARIIRQIRPRFVLAENVPGLLSIDDGGGFGSVLRDLAALGYDAEWDVLSAADVGAPHLRERVWILAHVAREQSGGLLKPGLFPDSGTDSEMEHSDGTRRQRLGRAEPQGDAQLMRASQGDVADSKGKRCGETGTDSGRSTERTTSCSNVENAEGQRRKQRGPECERQERSPSSISPSSPVPDPPHSEPLRGVGKQGDHPTEGSGWDHFQRGGYRDERWWSFEPAVGRLVDGLAYRVDQLRCTGNGVVPQCAVKKYEKIIRMARENS